MNNQFKLNALASALAVLALASCGDAETNIVEKDSIEKPDEHDDHGDEYTIESMGRLAVLSAENAQVSILDLDTNSSIDSFSLTHTSNSLYASAGYRYAVITSRTNDYVGFIDGGLWREDHVAHLHDYKQQPSMSDYELTASRPTHVVTHDGQLAVFYDGDAESSAAASVQVISDTDIAGSQTNVNTLTYTINMHGVAEPRGEHLLSTIRRDDVESTSAAKILPDQVGVYHAHDGEFELEQTFGVTCPDLHGAAQNEEFVLFGCSDGVLMAEENEQGFSASKIANIDDLHGGRIGTLYGHEDSELFIGIAAAHGGNTATLLAVNPEENSMSVLEWQPTDGIRPAAYSFANHGEYFLVLETNGTLNILEQHVHDGSIEWEHHKAIDVRDGDTTAIPDGMSFSLTVAQNGHYAYVADPVAKHVVQIDLETFEESAEIDLGFAPSQITWLGIAEEEHEDHDEHDHHDH
ncbi:putative lipoprotein [Catenovulum agarivorans DS-2]|uniref:Putative lipoprotein n=1 Tax=Catenovulum agarivorans DS-2 TaxID=1328313 RepID=W7QWW9_9ALTE|nr:hypothetical protein [Catenovulum agarivorans]EWH09770.1 putative lipoprotein [Catenovulum agarivorans DS-2]